MANNQDDSRPKPNIDHITSLFENSVLGAFVTGHLILESVLAQLIETRKKDGDIDPYSLSFHSKVKMALNRGLIFQSTAEFLIEVNKIRNNLAHRLGYEINFETVFELAKRAALGGIDFSDDTIHHDKELSEDWYGIEGTIQEIFQNAAQDLSFLVEQNGGKFQFC